MAARQKRADATMVIASLEMMEEPPPEMETNK